MLNDFTNDLHPSWRSILQEEFNQPYFREILNFLRQEVELESETFPPLHSVLNSFNHTPFDEVKVVILGQDPYHGPGQAHGLAFSVPDGVRPPPSLRNIFKELQNDLNLSPPHGGNLEKWARQGVFLLNCCLTVRYGQPGSHSQIGWNRFTDRVITLLSGKRENLVFMLWGNFAQKKEQLIDSTRHFILKAPHPSPLAASRGFLGSKPFSQANDFLARKGIDPVNWQL